MELARLELGASAEFVKKQMLFLKASKRLTMHLEHCVYQELLSFSKPSISVQQQRTEELQASLHKVKL